VRRRCLGTFEGQLWGIWGTFWRRGWDGNGEKKGIRELGREIDVPERPVFPRLRRIFFRRDGEVVGVGVGGVVSGHLAFLSMTNAVAVRIPPVRTRLD
jgi:hypothetical protein